jgi:hypothetical protein
MIKQGFSYSYNHLQTFKFFIEPCLFNAAGVLYSAIHLIILYTHSVSCCVSLFLNYVLPCWIYSRFRKASYRTVLNTPRTFHYLASLLELYAILLFLISSISTQTLYIVLLFLVIPFNMYGKLHTIRLVR